jgi:hypothetical protein
LSRSMGIVYSTIADKTFHFDMVPAHDFRKILE